MTAGMILDASFALYFQHFWTFLALGALCHVPHLLLLAGWGLALEQGASQALLMAAYFLGYLVWLLVLLPWATGAGIVAAREAFLGRLPAIGPALGQATRRAAPLLLANFVVELIVRLGYLLLVVPGVIWLLTYCLALPVVMLEGHDSGEARRRSDFLTSNHRVRIGAVLLVVWLVSLNAQLGGMGLLSLLLDPTRVFTGLAGQATQFALAIVTAPLGIIASVLLYYDLRIRKEAFDLEVLSAGPGFRPDPR